jgi:hypothetical protein
MTSLPRFALDDLGTMERLLRERSGTPLDDQTVLLRCLNIYTAQIALPDIRASLQRAAADPLFLAESIRRIANLRPPVRDFVYGHLLQIMENNGTLLQPAPEIPAARALLFEREASIEERIEAVNRSIASFERLRTEPVPVVQPPFTARIIVRYQGNPGDRLFLHGTGPGMQGWQRGIEMRRENNLWVYESREPFERFEFKVMLNDQQWETGENHTIATGKPVVLHTMTFQDR